jgi:hypothetical protein
MKTRVILSTLSAAILALMAFTPALALPPVHEIVHFEGALDPVDCGDFVLLPEYVTDAKITTFFDQDGNPSTLHVQVPIEFTLTNTATGEILSDKHHYLRIFDFKEGTHTFVGMLWSVTIPGKGVVVLDAGRFIVDAFTVGEGYGNILWQAGPHDGFNEDFGVCEAFQ